MSLLGIFTSYLIMYFLDASGTQMYTVDTAGILLVWHPNPLDGMLCSLRGLSTYHALPPNPIWVEQLNGQIWAFWLEDPTHSESLCELQVYNVMGDRPILVGERGWKVNRHLPDALGTVTCATVIPSKPDVVFVGHMCVALSVRKLPFFLTPVSLAKVGTRLGVGSTHNRALVDQEDNNGTSDLYDRAVQVSLDWLRLVSTILRARRPNPA